MDEVEVSEDGNLIDAVKTGDTRKSLTAIRDYLAHELEGNRCRACQMSQLRTGDTAALVLRLTKVIEEIAALPPEVPAIKDPKVVTLDDIRNRRASNRASETTNPASANHGTKSAPRRQGGRKPTR